MAFNLQDDNGSVVGANAYVSVADFKVYHDDRGRADAYGSATNGQIQAAIVAATSYLDGRFDFVGYRQQAGTQTTQWPRYDALDDDFVYVTGIPQEVKDATAEYALRALAGVVATPTANTLLPDPDVSGTGGKIGHERLKAGPVEIETTYALSGEYHMPPYPYADMILRKRGLVTTGRRIVRGS